MNRGMSAWERINAAADVILGVVVVFRSVIVVAATTGAVVAAATTAAVGGLDVMGTGDKNGRGSWILTVIFSGGGGNREERVAILNTFWIARNGPERVDDAERQLPVRDLLQVEEVLLFFIGAVDGVVFNIDFLGLHVDGVAAFPPLIVSRLSFLPRGGNRSRPDLNSMITK
jgi:hypothetical protein